MVALKPAMEVISRSRRASRLGSSLTVWEFKASVVESVVPHISVRVNLGGRDGIKGTPTYNEYAVNSTGRR